MHEVFRLEKYFRSDSSWHRLYFLPLPHQQTSLRLRLNAESGGLFKTDLFSHSISPIYAFLSLAFDSS